MMVLFTLPVHAGFSDQHAEQLMNEFNYSGAKAYIIEKLQRADTMQQQTKLFYFTQLAFAQYRLKNADSALYAVRSSLRLTRGAADSSLIANAWRAAAYCYNLGGILDSAVLYSQKLLSYGQRNHDLKLTKNALNSLAALSNNNDRPEIALSYFKEVYEINQKIGDTADMGGNLFNLGFTYRNLEKYDSSLYYLEQSIEQSKKYNNSDLLILTYNITADSYRSLGNFDRQMEYLLLSNQLAEKTGNFRYKANNLYELMMRSLKKQEYAGAVTYGEEALRFFSENPSPLFNATFDSLMYAAHKGMKNDAKALAFFESYVARKNTHYSEKQWKALTESMAQLEVDKKNLIIQNQETEIISNRRYLIIVAAVAVILLLLIAGLVTHIVKTRQFRHELYMKEEYLDTQIQNLHKWMQWNQMQAEEGKKAEMFVEDDVDSNHPSESSTTRQSEVLAALYDLCENQKIYLDPELTQEKVIKMLGTNKKYLYEAVSSSTSENFKGLINRYRVNEAKKQLRVAIWNKKEVKMEDILVASGFVSTSSFYRVFKSITGLTPSEYVVETRADFLRQNRESLRSQQHEVPAA